MGVIHWLATAFSTYVLHVEHGNGYQWWSGFGGRSLGVGTAGALWWHHRNCEQAGCWRIVKRGQTHCPKHR